MSADSSWERSTPEISAPMVPVNGDTVNSRAAALPTAVICAPSLLATRQRYFSSVRSASAGLRQPVSASAFSSSSWQPPQELDDAGLPRECERPQVRSPDQHGVRSETQRPQDVTAAANAAVDHHGRGCDGRGELLDHRGRRHHAVELTAAVIRDDHAGCAVVDRGPRVVRSEQALHEDRQRRERGDALDRRPRDRRVERRRVRPRTDQRIDVPAIGHVAVQPDRRDRRVHRHDHRAEAGLGRASRA